MNPDFPGATGSFDQSGVVHPHEACTLKILTGLLLLFVKVNSCVTGPACSLIEPKSCMTSLNSKGLTTCEKAHVDETKQINNNLNRIVFNFDPKFKTNSVLLYFIFFALWQEFLQAFKVVAGRILVIF
jgi:hypothetical protein